MDEGTLSNESIRKEYFINVLRKGDMGESMTNSLMEKLSEDRDILTKVPNLVPENGRPFLIKERNDRDITVFTTRIGTIRCSDVLTNRLKALYTLHNPPRLINPDYLANMARSIFLLLHRYSYIDPGFVRQGFLGPTGFKGIEEAFGFPIDLEAFSSAINTTVPTYCSLFPDVESPFGSIGSFFDIENLDGMRLIQVSPPRVDLVTRYAVKHCVNLIERTNHDVWFVLLTPYKWKDISSMIDSSGYCVWMNRNSQRDKIEYYDAYLNLPSKFAKPRVSVLSKRRISKATSTKLDNVFSRTV